MLFTRPNNALRPEISAICGVALTAVILATTMFLAMPAIAQALNDLAPNGWTRNSELNGIRIDQYTSGSGAIKLDLLSFPKTEESAADWIESFVQIVTKPDRDNGLNVRIINDDELGSTKGPLTTSSDNIDIATRSVMVLRPDSPNLFVSVRAIVREGEPVQVSFLTPSGTPIDEEYEQASKIRYDARMPLNESAAFLGLEGMAEVMTSGLIYPLDGTSAAKAEPVRNVANKSTSPEASATPAGKVSVTKRAVNPKRAPLLVDIPGPRVKITGKMLGGLPAGYRMNLTATNYWTNRSMTATRSLHLTLTKDGQFSKGRFSIAGSADGSVGTITAADKNGSTGSVLGGTNPGQSQGASAVYLKKREGVDPAMYGTYYISGNELELRYANGQTEKSTFKTNGYSTLVIDDKKYFVSTPEGWEKFTGGKHTKYRSLDGSYIATVTPIKKSVKDGVAYLNDYIARGKSQGLIVSAEPVSKMKTSLHGVVKSSMVIRVNGKKINRDFYLRHGANSTVSRFVQINRFEGASGDDKVLAFLEDV